MKMFRVYERGLKFLGPWGTGYVAAASLATMFLLLWTVSGNGSDTTWLLMMAVGLPGSILAAVIGACIQIFALSLSAFLPAADAGGSGLSPVGYLLWTLIGLIHVAVIAAQAVTIKLIARSIGGRRCRRSGPWNRAHSPA